MIPNYSRVKLVSNKYEKEGARIGMIGYVIECYDTGEYEVDFSNDKGVKIGQMAVSEQDLVLFPETKSNL